MLLLRSLTRIRCFHHWSLPLVPALTIVYSDCSPVSALVSALKDWRRLCFGDGGSGVGIRRVAQACQARKYSLTEHSSSKLAVKFIIGIDFLIMA